MSDVSVHDGIEPRQVDLWSMMAHMWRNVTPPLRPQAEDLGFCVEAAGAWLRSDRSPRVLILGVTPEYYALPWPAGTDLLAADRCRPMIEQVWPGTQEAVLLTDWLDLPLSEGSRDLVLCDLGLSHLAYPQAQGQLAERLRAIVAEDGVCLFRLATLPAQPEPLEAIFADMFAGREPSLAMSIQRLCMALTKTAEEGVGLDDVWKAFHAVVPHPEQITARIGLPLNELQATQLLQDSAIRYHFVSVEQVTDLFCRRGGGFAVQRVYTPAYDRGEQFPTIALRRVAAG